MENKKTSKKGIIIGVVILVVLIAAAAILYQVFKPEAVEGSKKITVDVVSDNGDRVEYSHSTDQEYLRGAIEEIEELTVEGDEGDYGLYVKTVNGVTADYDVDGTYWSFYVNGEYCNYSVDEQPVMDGDHFEIVFEGQ